jgi:hypothetical protein
MVKRGYEEFISNAYSAAKLDLYNQEVELEEAPKCGRDWRRKPSSVQEEANYIVSLA